MLIIILVLAINEINHISSQSDTTTQYLLLYYYCCTKIAI